jgi:hypothetical protein
MTLFLMTFFLIYGGMHFYLFTRIRNAIPMNTGAAICLVFLFVLMILAPLAVRLAERHGLESFARFTAYTGYIWMGVMFIFFMVSLLLDLYRLILGGGGILFHGGVARLQPSPLFLLIFPAFIALTVNAYGYFEAMDVKINVLTFSSPKIPEKIGRVRIVQISDVHIGIVVREERLKGIVEKIHSVDPDILISTGDLLDGQIDNLEGSIALLKSIQPKYGKFAVMGNHEYYAGLDESIDFTTRSGFSILRDEGTIVSGSINIVGMDDPVGRRLGLAKNIEKETLLSEFPGENFTLLLKHQPIVDSASVGMFDLQLSGHTHGGQIFPFCLITRIFFPTHTGYYEFARQSRLYVNRGAGTWGPPIRFLAPPEITVIDLVHTKNDPTLTHKERSS